MSELIMGTYEKLVHIGEGGGGEVFLARHLRLDKMVVMKADKRKVTTRPGLLRREVDVLKDLSHSYIPKVFDYFIENETVYTVMDYIDGESLDKPLKRGERFSQPQVIEWARELLQALSYLHSPTHGDPPRGYVHSDIKPANLMLTPQGTICLIDFNIALALGEENVVGASAGYASPEHYGLDYSSGFTAMSKTQRTVAANDKTELLESEIDPNAKTELLSSDSVSPSSSSIKRIMPDVRSDIYSTGATLYHLLCGKRPAKNATEVEPLSDKEFSKPLADIINKAMNPNPDLRYQTAEEMLYELEHLHENDPRVKRQRRGLIVFESVMCAALAIGVFTSFTGLKRIQAMDNALKLAEYSDNAMSQGNTDLAVDYAIQALPRKKSIFTPEPTAQAQCALAAALKVYDLSDSFKPERTVELPSAPLDMALSPDEKTFVCVCSAKTVIVSAESGEIIAELETDKSALSQVKYIDGSRIVYAAEGALKAYDISQKSEIWSGEAATSVAVSADCSTVAAVYKDNTYAVVYDAKTGVEKSRVDFGGRKQVVAYNDSFINPEINLFALNADGTMLAASFEDGSLLVWEIGSSEPLIEVPTSPNTQFSGGFYKNTIAFSAISEGNSAFLGYDFEEGKTVQSEASYPMYAMTDASGIYLKTEN
ncbi:MAG: serine/threonine-protein kinase, partial [Ruminococcus sp.]|nr:serine/threonine-protein kinase [Ruminococcus sp.]